MAVGSMYALEQPGFFTGSYKVAERAVHGQFGMGSREGGVDLGGNHACQILSSFLGQFLSSFLRYMPAKWLA